MGHIRPQPQLEVLYQRIFAKGSATIEACIEICKSRKIPVDCAEAAYGAGGSEGYDTDDHDYMYGHAFDLVVAMACGSDQNWEPKPRPQVIVPDPRNDEERELVEMWMHRSEEWYNQRDLDDKYEILYRIPWKFGDGWRQKYTSDFEHLPTVGEITL